MHWDWGQMSWNNPRDLVLEWMRMEYTARSACAWNAFMRYVGSRRAKTNGSTCNGNKCRHRKEENIIRCQILTSLYSILILMHRESERWALSGTQSGGNGTYVHIFRHDAQYSPKQHFNYLWMNRTMVWFRSIVQRDQETGIINEWHIEIAFTRCAFRFKISSVDRYIGQWSSETEKLNIIWRFLRI